jgi:hypothetical protein
MTCGITRTIGTRINLVHRLSLSSVLMIVVVGKFYDHLCQVILLSLYFNKHAKLQELRNTVDSTLRLQSKSPLDDDTWRACMKILSDRGLVTI